MARQLKEIRNFNIGNVTNADSREAPDEGAAMSRGIDPNAPNGTLRGNFQEDYKGNSINYAKYLVDTNIILDGATNNTDVSHTLSSVEGLVVGDWLSIGNYAFQILAINSISKVITTGTANRFGAFGSTLAIPDRTVVYKIPNPKQVVTYVKDKNEDVENAIIFDEEGSINGIENIQENVSGTLGKGINTGDDFTNFPLSVNHSGDLSIVRKGLAYFLGTGKNTKSKWLGKVGNLALNSKKGFILEDAELYAADYGSGNNTYDKVVTYQYVTTSSSTLVKTPRINNETGVFHVGFSKGESWIYIIDGDSGFVNRSIDVGFPITAIAKVTSCVTDARIWLYEEIDDLTKFATEPGKIHCYEIFDLNGSTELINLEISSGFPIGIPLSHCHTIDCHWGQGHSSGYPSQPHYNQGIHQTTHPDAPVPIPEVTDILETVDSSGNGKLWILASPQGNSENNEWFRTSILLEVETRMLLHRFMWSSYSSINGDLDDGTTVTTYFNDKSMPLAHIQDTGAENRTAWLDNMPTENVEDSYQKCQQMSLSKDAASFRLMKRSVPGQSISGYTEPAQPTSGGLQDYTTTVTWNTASGLDDGETRLYSLCHGGGYWYTDAKGSRILRNDGTAATDAKLTMQWDLTNAIINGNSGHNKEEVFTDDASYFQHRIDGETRWCNFKPMPYSLVDLSDLYDGVDHVVGCVVKMSDTTTPVFMEDMWMSHHDAATGNQHHEITKGLRLIGMGGKSLLWISNASRNNYGALYNKSNSFGYDTSNGSDASHFDGLNLSTLGFDKNENIVRQIKVLGDSIPSTGITSISRNKATHEYNVFQNYNDRDSRFSGLFISYSLEEGNNKGLIVRLNTTVEQGDTVDGITDYNGNEVVIIDDHESGLAGYADSSDDSDLSTSPGIIDNPGTSDGIQQYPANQNASAQSNGAQSVSNLSSLTVETLASHAGINGSPEAPNEVFPNGAGIVSYFDTNNFFRKTWYNGSSATTLSNLYTEAEHDIADNRAIILRGDNFQKGFMVDSGPYEGEGTDFPDNGTVTKYGAFLNIGGTGDATPSNIDTSDTIHSTFAYVWPKGTPAKADGTDADDEGRHSQYGANDYYFTYFNKGGKNNLYYGGLSSILSGSTGRINSFGDNASPDFIFRQYINRLYQYTKKTTVEFTDGEDHVTADDGDYPKFPNGVTRYYKISYEYDGYQDSPLTNTAYSYKNTTGTDKKNLDIKIRIPFNITPRVSAVNLWRRGHIENDTEGMAYYRVARLKLLKGGGWEKIEDASGTFYEQDFTDTLISNESYKDFTGISESVQNSNLNYEISEIAGNKLYVAGIKHALLPEGDNSLAWSKTNKFSMFDIQNDRLDLEDEVTALKVFNNVLFAFTLNKIYKIDPNSNTIIDIMEGFGCSNKDAVVVTEYGMFFADKNHIYKYDGAKVTILSFPVDKDFSGSDGWTDLTGTTGVTIRLYFSSKYNLLIALGTSRAAASTTNAFTYHVLKQRWDYRYFSIKDSGGDFNVQSIMNNILIPSKLGGNLYAFTNAEGKGDDTTSQACKLIEVNKEDEQSGQIHWESKDFTMGMDTNDKRFIKIKVEASTSLTTAPVVYIDGLLNTLVSSGTNEWKIKKNAGTGAVQKGKKIKVQFNPGNDNIEIYSIGIVYRTLKVK